MNFTSIQEVADLFGIESSDLLQQYISQQITHHQWQLGLFILFVVISALVAVFLIREFMNDSEASFIYLLFGTLFILIASACFALAVNEAVNLTGWMNQPEMMLMDALSKGRL